jgi:hypothetical protein
MMGAAIVALFVLGVIIRLLMARQEDADIARRRRFDQAEGCEEVAPGVALLAANDWRGLSQLYRKLSPSDRYHFVQGLGARASMEAIDPPKDADSAGLAIAGGLQIARAWKFRGSGIAVTVTEAGANRMAQSLLEAQRLLIAAQTINPYDSVPLAFLIRSEMALSGNPDVLDDALQKLSQTGEHNIFAAANHLQFASPKWQGSIAEMWRVANDYATHGPNAAWLAIAARAHIEEWLYCMNFDSSRRDAYVAKMQDTTFTDFCREMDRMFWEKAGQTSMSRSEANFAHNNFAFFHRTFRNGDLVGRHLKQIGPYLTALPWGYNSTDDLMGLLDTMRKEAGLAKLDSSPIATTH